MESKYGPSARLTTNQAEVFPTFDAGPQQVNFTSPKQIADMQENLPGGGTLPSSVREVQVMRWAGGPKSAGFTGADFQAVVDELSSARSLTPTQASLLAKLRSVPVSVP